MSTINMDYFGQHLQSDFLFEHNKGNGTLTPEKITLLRPVFCWVAMNATLVLV